MSDTTLEAEPIKAELTKPRSAGLGVDDLPSLAKRAANAFTEIALFCAIAMVIAIAEFYCGGFTGPTLFGRKLFDTPTPGDFDISNWWLAAIVFGVWNLVTYVRANTTAAGSVMQLVRVDNDGNKASPAKILLREAIRFGVLYAVPIWLFSRNQIVFAAVFLAAGFFIRATPMLRAPWDLIAGTTIADNFESASAAQTGPLTIDDLQVAGLRNAQNQRARRLLYLAGWGAIVVSILIVWVVFSEAWEFVTAQDFSWNLLNIEGKRRGWFPRRDMYDLSTLFIGTLWVTGIAMAVAGPVGLGVAIYLSEYAKPRVQRIVKPIIESLASVPSVVIGMFAIFFVSPSVLSFFFDEIGIFSILAAGIGVGVLTIPLVASIAEDALRAVPMALRQAAYGLGARKITVALKVVFPAALSGISAALIVGISRAIGETMVVAIAAGGSGGTLFQLDAREPGQTITAAMASLGAGTDQVAGSGIAFQSLYFLGALLFIMTLLLNVFSDAIVRRFREVY